MDKQSLIFFHHKIKRFIKAAWPLMVVYTYLSPSRLNVITGRSGRILLNVIADKIRRQT